MLAVNADSGLHLMKDVLIKARDNHLSYASPGRGTVNHLTAEWIAMETGAKLQHISYKEARRQLPRWPQVRSPRCTFLFFGYLVCRFRTCKTARCRR